MLELITMSLLGVAYINARINEANEEKKRKEEQRIRELKIEVFCYAVKHKMLYNQVVKKIQNGEINLKDVIAD